MIYEEAADVMMEELLPRLEENRHTTKEGFIETMRFVGKLRELTIRKGRSKYNQEFFVDLWSDEV